MKFFTRVNWDHQFYEKYIKEKINEDIKFLIIYNVVHAYNERQ